MDWSTAAAAGAFVAGGIVGAFLAVRLTRIVWDGAVRARRDLEDGPGDANPPQV
jgi:hypothetical protein